MGSLKPIGSEKLQGIDKIRRIMEIARYNENTPESINETASTEFSKTLADGRRYEIVKERNGYVIKRTLNESTSDLDYIEPMKNRKYYSSYSQALKRLNLVAREVNVNEGYEKGMSLFTESENDETKYVLKQETSEQAAPAPAPVPAPAPSPAPAPAPAPAPEDDLGGDELPDDMGDEENDEEEKVTLKTIQKLTGKLAQKIREFNGDEEEEMSSKDMKYVINSILSALDIDNMDENDIESIVDKLEGVEEEGMDGEGMGMDDEGMDMDDEGMDSEISGEEMAEGFDDFETKIARGNRDYSGDEFKRLPKNLSHDNLKDDSMSIHKFNKKYGHGRHRHDDDDLDFDLQDLYELDKSDIDAAFENLEEDDMSDYPKHGARRPRKTYEDVYSESKVDKVLQKYFKPSKTEKLIKENKTETVSKIRKSSTNVVQEMVSLKTVKQYPNIKFLGKSKNNNLVFEHNNKRLRITPNGDIL